MKAGMLSFRFLSNLQESDEYYQRMSPSKLGHSVLGNREGFFKMPIGVLIWSLFQKILPQEGTGQLELLGVGPKWLWKIFYLVILREQ